MAISDYRWAAGNNVALANLKNIENELRPRNYRTVGDAPKNVGIRSQPVDAFPVRTRLMNGQERGDGRIDHALDMVLMTYAVRYVLDTYLSSGTVVSAPMTLYTRRHELDSYARYNANLTLPSVENGDLEYLRQGVFRVRWRFTNLEAL